MPISLIIRQDIERYVNCKKNAMYMILVSVYVADILDTKDVLRELSENVNYI